jgi:poly(hydroxyalkanoate) depolymerase family esterase
MLNKLGHKVAAIANMAKLAAKTPHGSRWEKLLSTLTAVQAWSDQVDAQEHRLLEVTRFRLQSRRIAYVWLRPRWLPAHAPLVVVLHGCTQSAASYNKGSGWSTLADRHGFALLFPQQQWNNNPLRCFNWFKPEDNERERVSRSRSRRWSTGWSRPRPRSPPVYVTGTSSGGAMTTVMLATYPEVFAGGAVLAGVPYRTAKGLQEGLESIFQGRCVQPSGATWCARRLHTRGRGRSSRSGMAMPIPRSSRSMPKRSSSNGPTCTASMPADDPDDGRWLSAPGLAGADGEELIESYTITGMSHGAALDPGAEPHQCGTAAPFFNAVGISSTHRIADFWGLLADRPASARTRPAREGEDRGGRRCGRSAGGEAGSDARPSSNAWPRGCFKEQALAMRESGARRSAEPMIGAGQPAGPSASMCMASFRHRWKRRACSRGQHAPPGEFGAAGHRRSRESFRRRWKRQAC